MPYIAGYLLKLSISLSVVYLFYALVLRRLTFYTWNRWYLLGYSLLAFFIPFVNISPVLQNNHWHDSAVIQFIPVFVTSDPGSPAHSSQGFAWWSLLLTGALAGVLLMMIRFIIRYISFQRIRRSAQLVADGGVKVYHVDKSIIPFSFGNAIFINPQLHSEEELRQIVHHEFIHVKQKHTIDILWGELLCMLNWYNPFAWLIKKAIRQNLEFIADHKVLENGVDKKHYQYLLLKVTGAAHFSFTQQFNFSSLKKRIIMMNRSRSARIQLTRFLFLLPLLTVLLLAFRQNALQQERPLDTTSVEALEQLRGMFEYEVKIGKDTTPAPGAQKKWQEEFLKKNKAVKSVTLQTPPGKTDTLPVVVVTRHDGIVEGYNWNVLRAREQFKKRYSYAPPFDTKVNKIPLVTDSITVVDASLNRPGNPYTSPSSELQFREKNVLLVIDGELQEDVKKINEIPVETIESINVYKGEEAEKIYGDKAKGKEGVIEVKTKFVINEVTISAGTLKKINKDTLRFLDNPQISVKTKEWPDVLYIINGIEFSSDEFKKMELEPKRIEKIEVISNESAVKLYGQKARKGVIIITLKPDVTQSPAPAGEETRVGTAPAEPVISYIDGFTYARAGGGSSIRYQGEIRIVIVDGAVYSAEEVNKRFSPSDFMSVAAITAGVAKREHGYNEPAVVLSRGGSNFDRYFPKKSTQVGQ